MRPLSAMGLPRFFFGTLILLAVPTAGALADIPLPTATPVPSATPQPSTTPAPTPFVQELEPSDYDTAGIGVRFDGERIHVTGRLPEACASGLALTDVKKVSPESPPDAVTTADELNRQASHVGIRLRYTSPDGKYLGLADCISKAPALGVDLDGRTDLSRSILSSEEIALGGALNSKNEVIALKSIAQSRTHLRLSKLLEDSDCKSCNSDSRSVKKRLDELASLDFPWVKPLMASLLTSAITEGRAAIGKAETITELETHLANLESYAALVSKLDLDDSRKQELLHSIGEGYTELLSRNLELARSAAKGKGSKQESRHADFLVKTYRSMAKLPDIEKSTREEFLRLARENEKGGALRLEFISGLNPGHSEVRNALNNGQEDLQRLARQVQQACRWVRNQQDMVRCGQARQEYQMKLGNLQLLRNRWIEGQQALVAGQVAGAPATIAPGTGLQVYSTFGGPSSFGSLPYVPMNGTPFSGSPIPTAPGMPPFGG